MTAQVQTIRRDSLKTETATANWSKLYLLSAVTTLLIVLTALAEIAITFLPGGDTITTTVTDWFTLLQNDWFLGLRNLGLLNIVMVTLGIPLFLTLFAVHRNTNPAFAALAMIISYIGAAVFYATNRAFPLLELSTRYAAATTETQRAVLEAAGQSLLVVGQSHTPGTYLAFFLSEIAGILMAMVMLRGRIFSRATAYAGMAGFGCFFIFEIISSFVPSFQGYGMILAMLGGIASMVWYILIARRLFQLGLDNLSDEN